MLVNILNSLHLKRTGTNKKGERGQKLEVSSERTF